MEHLEAALALSDDTKEGVVGSCVESARSIAALIRGRGIWTC